MKRMLGVLVVLSLLGSAAVITSMEVWLFIHKGVVIGILGTILFPVTAIVFPVYLCYVSGELWPLLFYLCVLLGMLAVLLDHRIDEREMRKETKDHSKDNVD